MTAILLASKTGWTIGWMVGLAVVLVVVALVVSILLLARRIGDQATTINDSLSRSVEHTAALNKLNETNEAADAIVAGLARGRSRLGG
jgi:predicted PurR-regulated permease PerM